MAASKIKAREATSERGPGDRIRIAHIMGEFMNGGTERIVLDLLSRLDKSRFDIHVYCSSSEGLPEVREKFVKSGFGTSAANTGLGNMSGRGWGPRTASKKVLSLLKMTRELRKGMFTIVHTHGLTNNLYGRAAAIVAGAPIIITHEHNANGDSLMDRVLWTLLNFKTALNVSVSETVSEFRIRSVPASRKKMVTLLNGIDLEVFHPPGAAQRKAAREKFGIGEGEQVIGTMGRLVPQKRVDLFLRAAGVVLSKCPGVRFLIVGEGEERSSLEALVSTLGISQSVFFFDWAARPEEALWAMDVFTIVSDQQEGFGLVSAEAMACGLPVVAVDIPVNREIVSDACGVFANPDPSSIAQGILRLLQHDDLAFTMGTNSGRWASDRYDIRRAAAKLEDLYDQLANGHRCEAG